jgi:hypothetical protein
VPGCEYLNVTVNDRFHIKIGNRDEDVELKYIKIGNKYLFIRSENSPYAHTLGARRPILARTTRRKRHVLEELPCNHEFTVIDIAHGFILVTRSLRSDESVPSRNKNSVPTPLYEEGTPYCVYDFQEDGKLVPIANNVNYDPEYGRHRKPAQ